MPSVPPAPWITLGLLLLMVSAALRVLVGDRRARAAWVVVFTLAASVFYTACRDQPAAPEAFGPNPGDYHLTVHAVSGTVELTADVQLTVAP